MAIAFFLEGKDFGSVKEFPRESKIFLFKFANALLLKWKNMVIIIESLII